MQYGMAMLYFDYIVTNRMNVGRSQISSFAFTPSFNKEYFCGFNQKYVSYIMNILIFVFIKPKSFG